MLNQARHAIRMKTADDQRNAVLEYNMRTSFSSPTFACTQIYSIDVTPQKGREKMHRVIWKMLQPAAASRFCGGQPIFQAICVGSAGAVLRAVGQFHKILSIVDGSKLPDVFDAQDPGAMNA